MKTLRFLLLALVVACSTAGRGPDGAWQGPSGFLAVEPERLVWYDPAHNDLTVARVLQRDSDLVTRHRGRLERVRLAPEGDKLAVTIGENTELYSRIAAPPSAMSLAPLPLGPARTLPESTVKAISDDIQKRNAADQVLLRSHAPHEKIVDQEQSNDAYLRELVARYGWIDVTRFGGKTSAAAVVMAKHSADTRLLLAALPILESDLQHDRGFAQLFAIAYDQLLLSLGERQRYGSQVCSDVGTHPYLCSVETPSQLDARRASIGLDPIRDYLSQVSKMLFKGQDVRIPTDSELQ